MLRIVAGAWGGLRIQTPRRRATRPTSERVREALFNVLAHRLQLADYPVLDLYAGSGALGVEALSRGVPKATFVEQHPPTARLIAENLRRLNAPSHRWQVVPRPVEHWLGGAVLPETPLLVLLDPPYATPALPTVLGQLAQHAGLSAGSWVVVETAPPPPTAPPPLELELAKRYGETLLVFFSKSLRHGE